MYECKSLRTSSNTFVYSIFFGQRAFYPGKGEEGGIQFIPCGERGSYYMKYGKTKTKNKQTIKKQGIRSRAIVWRVRVCVSETSGFKMTTQLGRFMLFLSSGMSGDPHVTRRLPWASEPRKRDIAFSSNLSHRSASARLSCLPKVRFQMNRGVSSLQESRLVAIATKAVEPKSTKYAKKAQ